MPKVNWSALKTNENGARTKALIAAGIFVAVTAVAIAVAKKPEVAKTTVLVVEEASDALVDAV